MDEQKDNLQGETSAFCTFSHFKSLCAWLRNRVVLFWSPTAVPAVRSLQFLHYAYFARVSREKLRRAGIPTEGALEHGGLLFISAYNGDEDDYFGIFSAKVPKQMNDLWGGSRDWKGAQPYPTLKKFIQAYRRPSVFYFNAYPDSVKNLRLALQVRLGIDDLLALARTGSPDEFLTAYRKLIQSAWGNG